MAVASYPEQVPKDNSFYNFNEEGLPGPGDSDAPIFTKNPFVQYGVLSGILRNNALAFNTSIMYDYINQDLPDFH